MSRQNKQMKIAAREKMFKNGGPASTTPKHGKKSENRVYTKRCRSLAEFQERNKQARKGSKSAKMSKAV